MCEGERPPPPPPPTDDGVKCVASEGCLGAVARMEGKINVHWMSTFSVWLTDSAAQTGWKMLETDSQRLYMCKRIYGKEVVSVDKEPFNAGDLYGNRGWPSKDSYVEGLFVGFFR